jgi:hypothetical protein
MPYLDPEKRHAYGREWMKRNPEKAREAMRRGRARDIQTNTSVRGMVPTLHIRNRRTLGGSGIARGTPRFVGLLTSSDERASLAPEGSTPRASGPT